MGIIYPSMVDTELIAGLHPPRFPAPVTPEQVAEVIVKAVRRKKSRSYIPKMGFALSFLPYVLPDRVLDRLAEWTGLTSIFQNVDETERKQYHQRIKYGGR